jgi:hypothetical protein
LDQCLCQSTKNPVFCEKCQHIQEDWIIYSAIYENNQEYKQQIQLKIEKVIPIGELNKKQYHWSKNDLFYIYPTYILHISVPDMCSII